MHCIYMHTVRAEANCVYSFYYVFAFRKLSIHSIVTLYNKIDVVATSTWLALHHAELPGAHRTIKASAMHAVNMYTLLCHMCGQMKRGERTQHSRSHWIHCNYDVKQTPGACWTTGGLARVRCVCVCVS